MSGLDPCDFPSVSPVTDGGDKPFCPDELCVNALDRLNSTGETMVLDARHLDEGEAGFSSTRTGLFRVTKPAPNEARMGLWRPLIVARSFAPSMRLGLSSLRPPCLFCDMPPVLSDAFTDRQSTSGKGRFGDERTAQVKRTHGHDRCRMPFEAKEKDPGYALL
jgi:hypothetical protein